MRIPRCTLLVMAALCVDGRAEAGTGRGSLLVYPHVEIIWDDQGRVVQDVLLTLSNDYRRSVRVQMFFRNGDPPADELRDGATLIERAHPGWNRVGCGVELSRYQVTHWSAATGLPGACAFTALDARDPPGRPLAGSTGDRVLRGAIYLFAVDATGAEINWNLLRGDATVVNVREGASFTYNAHAFLALVGATGDAMPEPGVLRLDGAEYEAGYDTLLFNFFSTGRLDGFLVDTRLILLPLEQDFRQDHDGPVLTKARFSITNEDEVRFSGTETCVTCWDSEWLSTFDRPNHFLKSHIHTDTGTATVEGIPSDVVCGEESRAAALLGLAVRTLTFSPADWNADGAVDLLDYAAFAACLNSSGPDASMPLTKCADVFDGDKDQDVDLQDFQSRLTAPVVSRSFSAAPLVGLGMESAVIRYDLR